jgi:hypothetical protein
MRISPTNDSAEGGADDHADGEIDDVSPQREFLELLQHDFAFLRRLRRQQVMTVRKLASS